MNINRRNLLRAVLALMAMLVVALLLLVWLVDPRLYREELARRVSATTGLQLRLGGELHWRFYPVLGFGAGDVALSLRADLPELARIESLTFGLELLPLLSGRLVIDALEITGLQAQLAVDAQGVKNWQLDAVPAALPEEPVAAAPAPGTEAGLSALRLSLLRLRDASLVYRDAVAGSHYSATINEFSLRDLAADTQASVTLDAAVSGLTPAALTLRADGTLALGTAQRPAMLALPTLQLAGIPAQLRLQIQGGESPAITGTLESALFDPRATLSALGLPVPTTGSAQALRQMAIKTDFAASPQQLALNALDLQLDQSHLRGELAIAADSGVLAFDLALDQLLIDQYLPPASEVAPGGQSAGLPADGDALSCQLLQGLALNGQLQAASLRYQQREFRDLALQVRAADGQLHLDPIGLKLLQGSMQGALRAAIDAGGGCAITARLAMQDIELTELATATQSAPLISGKTNLSLNLQSRGASVDGLLQQALGQLDLNTSELVLHGVNINQLAADALQRRLGEFSSLLPDYQNRLPKQLSSDTRIRELLATMQLAQGRLRLPALTAQTGEGQLSAVGELDLIQRQADYRFGVVLAALADNRYLKDVAWPVHCRGALDQPLGSWCRPDSQQISAVLEKAAGRALRESAAQKLGSKLGVEASDEQALKAQLQQRKEQEREKAKDKIEGRLKNKLEGLLGR